MKTVKVKIALEIDTEGYWHACGFSGGDDWDEVMEAIDCLDGHHVKRHWIEAEIPVPAEDAEVIAGKAVEAAPAQPEAA